MHKDIVDLESARSAISPKCDRTSGVRDGRCRFACNNLPDTAQRDVLAVETNMDRGCNYDLLSLSISAAERPVRSEMSSVEKPLAIIFLAVSILPNSIMIF